MHHDDFILNCNFRTIVVEGKKVQTYSLGTGEKTIFSFPAYPHSGLMYILFMLKYDLTKVRLVTFDLPGWIGMTEAFDKKGYFDIETIKKIVDAIIKEYRMDRFNVLGFSYGSLLALMVANSYSDRIDRVALVSPIVKSSLASKSSDAFKLKFLKYSRLYFLIKPYVRWRFSIYNKPLQEEGIPSQFLYSYQKMMDSIQSRYLFESLYHLFFSDNADLLRNIQEKKILIANSKTETQYFRKQSGYIRQILKGEKSLYLEGEHQDFLLHPKKDVVSKIVGFLTV